MYHGVCAHACLSMKLQAEQDICLDTNSVHLWVVRLTVIFQLTFKKYIKKYIYILY